MAKEKPEKPKPLNSQQLKFCQHIADGFNNTHAYQRAYKGAKSSTGAAVSAIHLLTNTNVIKKIAELREEVETRNTLSRQQKREFLKRAVETPITDLDTEEGSDNADLIQEKIVTVKRDKDGDEYITTKIKGVSKLEAIKIDNLMTGDNEPDELNLTGSITGEIKISPIQFVRMNQKKKESDDAESA